MARIDPDPATPSGRSGFTIIELLASMAILVFIVLMMSRVFAEATSIWSLGAKRITTASDGRAIMDFMVKELTQAMADDVLSFKLSSGANPSDFGVSAYGADSDEVYFGAAVQSCALHNMRNVEQFAYFIAPMLDDRDVVIPNRYRLARTRRTGSTYSTQNNRINSIYKKDDWWTAMKPPPGYIEENVNGQACETIADNISAFEVWAYSEATGYYEPDYSSRPGGGSSIDNKDMLPLWVDIYLEMLSEEDAVKMAELWGADQARALEFLSSNVKRFTARVYFPNRERALAFKQ